MSPEAIRPVSPREAAEMQTEQIPDAVFGVFNELIAQNLYHGRSTVLQKDVVERLVEQGMDRGKIFEKHWLDVEDSYREAGWSVKYDKPVYWGGEDFDAYFEFTVKRNNR
jgi:hypothetical protein